MRRHATLTRTWQLLQALQARRCTLHELARDLGVTDRTIRRDLEALEAAGFPVYDEQNDHGVRFWRLMPTATVPGRRAA